jgi:hypothetical protein
MIEFDPRQFENELQTLKPAKPSQQSLQRIRAQLTQTSEPAVASRLRTTTAIKWDSIFRWFAPAIAAAAIAVLLLLHFHRTQSKTAPDPHPVASASTMPVLKADKVEIDRQFVTDFDAVTELPNGQPMRFRCEQWLDKVRVRDSAAGLMIERTTPRVEIVPVRFDTY